jgi:hypothetical protein
MGLPMSKQQPATIDDSPLKTPKPEVWSPPPRPSAEAALSFQSIVGDLTDDGKEVRGLAGEAKQRALNMLASVQPHYVVYPRDLSKIPASTLRQLRVAYRWLVDEFEQQGTVTVVVDYEMVEFMGIPERRDTLCKIHQHGVQFGAVQAADLCTRYKFFLRAVPVTAGGK